MRIKLKAKIILIRLSFLFLAVTFYCSSINLAISNASYLYNFENICYIILFDTPIFIVFLVSWTIKTVLLLLTYRNQSKIDDLDDVSFRNFKKLRKKTAKVTSIICSCSLIIMLFVFAFLSLNVFHYQSPLNFKKEYSNLSFDKFASSSLAENKDVTEEKFQCLDILGVKLYRQQIHVSSEDVPKEQINFLCYYIETDNKWVLNFYFNELYSENFTNRILYGDHSKDYEYQKIENTSIVGYNKNFINSGNDFECLLKSTNKVLYIKVVGSANDFVLNQNAFDYCENILREN